MKKQPSGFPTRPDTNKQGRNFGFKKKYYCNIRGAKTKALISCAVTAQLICAFVFAKAKFYVSHDASPYNQFFFIILKHHHGKSNGTTCAVLCIICIPGMQFPAVLSICPWCIITPSIAKD